MKLACQACVLGIVWLSLCALIAAQVPSTSDASGAASQPKSEESSQKPAAASQKIESAEADVVETVTPSDTITPGTADQLTPEKVQERQQEFRAKIEALKSSGLSEEDQKKATEFYQKAITSLASWEEYFKEKNRHETHIANYEADLAKFEQDLAQLTNDQSTIDQSEDLNSLEQQLAAQEQLVQHARDELALSEKQPKNRQTRMAEIPQLTAERQKELEKAVAKYTEVADADADDVLADAERNYLWGRVESLKMSLAEMEKQRQYFALSPDLVQLRRDYRAKFLTLQDTKLTLLRDAIDKRRLAEAELQASEAARAAAVERPEAVAELAKENAKLADLQASLAAKSTALTDEITQVQEQNATLKKEFEKIDVVLAAVELNEASGQQLRQQQELLPDRRAIGRRLALLAGERDDLTYQYFELMDRRSAVKDADPDKRVARILEKVPQNQRAAAEKQVRELLTTELDILASTLKTYESYSKQLTDLSVALEQLRTTAKDYADFITARVLWVRSTGWPRLADLEPAADALAWTIDPNNWQAALKALWTKSGSSPIAVVLFAVVIGFSMYMHRRLRNRLRTIGEQAEKRTSTDFWLSVEATWITLLMALPWPLFFGFLGWWMDSPLNESEFVRSLSLSLQFTALCLLLLETVRHLCRHGGLADAHFNWPQSCLLQVRRHVRWLIWACLPLVLWLTGLEVQNVEKLWSSSLGRACFVVVMLLMSLAAYRILLSAQSPFRQLLINNTESSAPRLFHVWSPIVTVLPFLLAVLAIVGYYYTAQQLALRLVQTAGLVLLLLIVGGLTRRWILVNRRRLAREQAKQKRAAAAAAAATNTVSDEAAPIPVAEITEDSVDFVALGEQTSKLVLTGLVASGLVAAWFVWGEMLPALSYFGQMPIFPRPDVKNALTWGQLLKFLLVVVVTYVAVRNLPALMEFAILQRLPLDSGSRYAITTISRYIFLAIGISAASAALNFDTTSLQWLVAAMGVGLGFGLQEIFANFVSGIILLFERPIRVGDVVTLGDKTGAVSRIRMRATTIVDADRKEYIVPNKDLITERLLNWTLSDTTNRIEIKVGIAYGSDTDLACRLLKECAAEHPLILKEPEPVATFDGFGASTLDFTLRCFLPTMEKRLLTIHELNTAINRKFVAADLEMAYPQTDVYVKSWPERWPTPGVRAVANGHTNGHGNGHEKAESKTNGKHA